MGLAALEILSNDYSLVPVEQTAGATRGDLVKRQTYDIMSLPVKDRRKALEKLEYCRLVYSVRMETGKRMQEACEIVSIKYQDRFQELIKRGKGGRSALNYDNCRHWIGRLGKSKDGSPDWQNVDALVDFYARGEKPRRGDEAFWTYFNASYLHRNQWSISKSYRVAAMKTRQENTFAVIPSLQQARYQVEKIPVPVRILARFGEEAAKNKFFDFIRRDWSAINPGDMTIGDHRQFDAPIKVWNKEKQKFEATRPWICGIMDARSWHMPNSYEITAENPNSRTIGKAILGYIFNNGMIPPLWIYNDNGKDFLAQGFSTPVEFGEHKHCVFKELGATLITSIPYNGKAKTIERMFRDMATEFDKWFAAYLGNKPGARPDVANFFYENPEFLPSLEEFRQIFAAWWESYIRTPKNGDIHKGKSPLEIWESRKVERPAWTEERLFYAMLRPEASLRQVNRGPCVSVDKKEFFDDKLKPYLGRGKSLMIKKDIWNEERVFAFEPDGRFVCECRTRVRTSAIAFTTEEGRAQISEGMKHARGELKEANEALNGYTGGLHVLPPLELFMAKGTDLKIEKAGERNSVKGASHRFKHYRIECGMKNDPPTPCGTPADGCDEGDEVPFQKPIVALGEGPRSGLHNPLRGSLSAREEKALKNTAELEAFGAVVMKPESEGNENASEEMEAFYNMVIKKKINEENEE